MSGKTQRQNSQWNSWQYNVVDEFKGKTKEEIKESLDLTKHPFAVLMEHWKGDFNIGTLIRNSNAFNAREVFYVGQKKYDRRGAVGTHDYIDLKHIDTFDDLWKLKESYTFVCLDNNIEGVVPMEDFDNVGASDVCLHNLVHTSSSQTMFDNVYSVEMQCLDFTFSWFCIRRVVGFEHGTRQTGCVNDANVLNTGVSLVLKIFQQKASNCNIGFRHPAPISAKPEILAGQARPGWLYGSNAYSQSAKQWDNGV